MTSTSRRPRFLVPLLAVLATLALGALTLYASPTHRSTGDRGRSSRFGHGEAISRLLVLDPAQKSRVGELVTQLRKDVSPLRGSRKALRDQMRAELEAPRPNAEKIGQLVIQARSHRVAARSARQQFDKDLTAVLRPEQLTRYKEWKAKHTRLRSGERGRGHLGHRGGRGGHRGSDDRRGPEGDDRPL